MCIVRKARSTYTLAEDVTALRELVAPASGVFATGGSAASKLQAWADVAERVSAHGVEVTGDGLRRHVGDLVKKHKKQGPDPPGGRMRWGMPWPKSDEEIERDRLIETYIKRLEDAKKTPVAVARPVVRATPTEQPTATGSAVAPVSNKLIGMPTPATNKPPARQILPPSVLKASPAPVYRAQSRLVHHATSTPTSVIPTARPEPQASKPQPPVKRKQPEPVIIEDDSVYCNDSWATEARSVLRRPSEEHAKLDLKRQRLEMEERIQNRMLDIQAEQISIQREQLRLQADAIESTQAIARALQALQARLP